MKKDVIKPGVHRVWKKTIFAPDAATTPACSQRIQQQQALLILQY
jgi:hypothetical protein